MAPATEDIEDCWVKWQWGTNGVELRTTLKKLVEEGLNLETSMGVPKTPDEDEIGRLLATFDNNRDHEAELVQLLRPKSLKRRQDERFRAPRNVLRQYLPMVERASTSKNFTADNKDFHSLIRAFENFEMHRLQQLNMALGETAESHLSHPERERLLTQIMEKDLTISSDYQIVWIGIRVAVRCQIKSIWFVSGC
jgi:hypothetical protein